MSTVIAMYCVTYKVRIIFTEWSFIFYDSKQTSTPLHLRGLLLRGEVFEGAPRSSKHLREGAALCRDARRDKVPSETSLSLSTSRKACFFMLKLTEKY